MWLTNIHTTNFVVHWKLDGIINSQDIIVAPVNPLYSEEGKENSALECRMTSRRRPAREDHDTIFINSDGSHENGLFNDLVTKCGGGTAYAWPLATHGLANEAPKNLCVQCPR